MKHVARTLGIVVAVLIAAGSSLLGSPAAQNFVLHHPGDAVYVTAATAVLTALGIALKARGTGENAKP